jgi:hypothetical protein
MARYIYQGPVQTIALATGHGKDADGNPISKFIDIDFIPGKETPDLPEHNSVVISMRDAGLLADLKAEPAKPSKTKTDATTGKDGEK